MIWMPLLAAGVGLGLWALLVYALPPRPPLAELINRLQAPPAPKEPVSTALRADDHSWSTRLGLPLVPLLARLGLPRPTTTRDLAITGRSAASLLADKAALALTGLLLPAAASAALLLGGRTVSWVLPAALALALATVGFFLPDVQLRSEAARCRMAFRHALGAYLNLIHILLAGGAGVDGALTDAAAVGRGPAFTQLRRALDTARLTRTSPWNSFGRLSDDLGVPELSELAAALSLAGTEGARIKASLAAKAAALRSATAADAEAHANAATERMVMPGVLMAAGFVLFIFFPALVNVSSSF